MEDGSCPYETLGLSITATAKEIKKGYYVLALKYHPDKNPGNAATEAKFRQIVIAYELLGDEKAKAAYDKVLKAQQAARLRDEKLSKERRQQKDDLVERENAARKSRAAQQDAKKNFQKEVNRLKEETERLIEAEQERIRNMMKEDLDEESVPVALKLKWSTKKVSSENGGYSRDVLSRLFSKYDEIEVSSMEKPGRAVIVFSDPMAAQLAFKSEKGLSQNPFSKVVWVGEAPEAGGFEVSIGTDAEEAAFEQMVLQKMYDTQAAKEANQVS